MNRTTRIFTVSHLLPVAAAADVPGYMKRGLSLLLAIFTLIAVAGFLSLGPLAFFTPVVWLYAFFDSYNLRRLIAQDAAPEDAYLFGLSDMDSQQMTALLKSVTVSSAGCW